MTLPDSTNGGTETDVSIDPTIEITVVEEEDNAEATDAAGATDVTTDTPDDEAPESQERPVTDPFDNLDALLESAEVTAQQHEEMVTNIDTLVAELRERTRQFHHYQTVRHSRKKAVDKAVNPAGAVDTENPLSKESATALLKLQILDQTVLDKINKLDAYIKRFTSLTHRTPEIERKLTELVDIKEKLINNLKAKVQEKSDSYEQRRADVRQRVLDHYNARAGNCKERIDELANSPGVQQRFEDERFMTEKRTDLHTASDRQRGVLDSWERALSDENFIDELLKTLKLEGNEQSTHVTKLRTALVTAVVAGKIESANQIVPWLGKSGNKYAEVMNLLRSEGIGNRILALADDKLRTKLKRAINIDRALVLVYGPEKDTDVKPKGGTNVKVVRSAFWKALAERGLLRKARPTRAGSPKPSTKGSRKSQHHNQNLKPKNHPRNNSR